jgi:hypothetical protein
MARKPPPPLEKHIQKVCLDWLNLQPGFFFFRVNSGAMAGNHKGKRWFMRFTSAVGCSDIIGGILGRWTVIEVKRPGEHPTEEQLAFLKRVRHNGGIALCIHSLEELIDGLRKHGIEV